MRIIITLLISVPWAFIFCFLAGIEKPIAMFFVGAATGFIASFFIEKGAK